MDIRSTLVLEFVKLFTVGIFSALLSYVIAQHLFISQRWWERKAETYSRIIEAAWGLLDYYGTHYDSAVGEIRELTPEQSDALQEKWRKGREEIKKAIVIGEFIVSKEAAACLKEYIDWKHEHYSGDWVEEIDIDFGRTKTLIDKLIELRRKDLKIPR